MTSSIFKQAQYTDKTFEGLCGQGGIIASHEFYDCVFIRCSFPQAVISKCKFNKCTFQHCDLSLMKVPETTFTATRFEDSKAIGINWTQADMGTRLGEPIGFFRSSISHCTFMGLALRGIQIQECIAGDVDFRQADLSHANFAGTDLAESLFSETNLTRADLTQARNYSICPNENILKKAKFSLPEAISLLYAMDIVLE